MSNNVSPNLQDWNSNTLMGVDAQQGWCTLTAGGVPGGHQEVPDGESLMGGSSPTATPSQCSGTTRPHQAVPPQDFGSLAHLLVGGTQSQVKHWYLHDPGFCKDACFSTFTENNCVSGSYACQKSHYHHNSYRFTLNE